MNASVYDFELHALDGSPMPMSQFAGKVLLLVNTASRCGFTPQYEGLQKLQERHAARGFSVIAFPCNQFGGQEPGTADDIAAFCRQNYGVGFPVTEKVDVNGEQAHPLFRYLASAAPGVLGTEAIKWNFTKFLVGRDGVVMERFAPMTRPEDLDAPIEALLGR